MKKILFSIAILSILIFTSCTTLSYQTSSGTVKVKSLTPSNNPITVNTDTETEKWVQEGDTYKVTANGIFRDEGYFSEEITAEISYMKNDTDAYFAIRLPEECLTDSIKSVSISVGVMNTEEYVFTNIQKAEKKSVIYIGNFNDGKYKGAEDFALINLLIHHKDLLIHVEYTMSNRKYIYDTKIPSLINIAEPEISLEEDPVKESPVETNTISISAIKYRLTEAK